MFRDTKIRAVEMRALTSPLRLDLHVPAIQRNNGWAPMSAKDTEDTDQRLLKPEILNSHMIQNVCNLKKLISTAFSSQPTGLAFSWTHNISKFHLHSLVEVF